MSTSARIVLVTGFPSTFLAVRVVRELLADDARVQLRCVVPKRFLERAASDLAKLPPGDAARVEVIEGDAAAMDLGLSGPEFKRLAGEVDLIHHCAAITYLGVERRVARDVNVAGAREVLELAEAADHLERLVHWSTTLVSGARRGYVLEGELVAPTGFRNVIEETRYRAERIIRGASKAIPTTILRPSIVVGDSVTGEIDRFEGPYLLVLLMLGAPPEVRIPVPRHGDIPLNIVPVDHVIDAAFAVISDPRSLGRTFHIVDPDPLSVRRVFELIARSTGRRQPRGVLPTSLATAILRTPGIGRLANVHRAFLEQLATEVVYDDRNTREILAGRGITCPPFESYVDTLVAYVQMQQRQRRDARELALDEDDDLRSAR